MASRSSGEMNEREISLWCAAKSFSPESNRKLSWLRVGDFSLLDALEGEGENGAPKSGTAITKKTIFFLQNANKIPVFWNVRAPLKIYGIMVQTKEIYSNNNMT